MFYVLAAGGLFQKLSGSCDYQVFELAASQRVVFSGWGDNHLGPGRAGCRPLGGDHSSNNVGLAP